MSDQREDSRRIASSRARLWTEGSEEPQEAWVRNVSSIGALLQAAPIDVGTRVRIILGSGPDEREIHGTVVREVMDMPGYQAGVPGVAIQFKS